MKSENFIVKLAFHMIEKTITQEEAVKSLKTIPISEKDINNALSMAELEADSGYALIISYLSYKASLITGKLIGESLFTLAGTLFTKQMFNEAMEHYDEALNIFIKNNQWIDVARCNSGKATIYFSLSKFSEGMDLCNKAREIFEKSNLWVEVAGCNLNKAEIYSKLKRFDEAIKLYDIAEKTFNHYRQFSGVAKCNFDKANVYSDSGRYEEAIKLYDKARKIFEESRQLTSVARCDSEKGNIYLKLGKPNKAIPLYDRAVDVFQEHKMWLDMFICNLNKANAYSNSGRFKDALTLYDKLRLSEQYDIPLYIARYTFGKAELYHNLKKFDKAIEFYDKALKIFEQQENFIDIASCHLNKATIYYDLKEFDKALFHYNKAQSAASYIPEIEWKCLNGLGDLFKAKGEEYLNTAIDYYKQSIDIIENKTLTDLSFLDIKTALREKALFVYEKLINILLEIGKPEDALEYLERIKSRNLIELISRIEICPHAPEEIIQKDREFKIKLSSLQFIFSKEKDPKKREKNLSEFEEIKKRYTTFVEFIKKEHDSLYEPFYEVKTITYKEIQSLLNDNHTALIEFYFSWDKSCAFIVKKDNPLEKVTLPITLKNLYENFSPYQKAYEEYSQFATTGTLLNWLKEMKNLLNYLYKNLFSPIKDKLTDISKIIFIPHKILFLIPLHAMYKQVDDKEKYIIEDYQISYAPGAQILKMCYDRNRSEKENLFAFLCDTKGNLKYSEEEVNNIKEFFLCKSVTEGKSYEELINYNGKNSFLHFSCHGKFFSNNPLESGLSVYNHNKEEVYFTLKDIFTTMYLPETYMVTLSACETGLIEHEEKYETGIVEHKEKTDEFIGLPSGFLFAGSPTVIASLWSVTDEPTGKLMYYLYKNIIKENMTRAEALKKAQLEIMNFKNSSSFNKTFKKSRLPGWSHPYYWAGFCCYGAD